MAPGQDILAAVAPPGNNGLTFNVYSGTSMSAPHVAGLAALLKQLHGDWSPMMIKSALMTTAYDVLDVPEGAGLNPAIIFRQGAGHVKPNAAADPGLVFDSEFNDWLAFLCGTTTGVRPDVCAGLAGAGYSLVPSDLNTPSIAIGALAGAQTVTRRVTNVTHRNATYTAAIAGLPGFTTAVTPPSLTIAPGRTKSFTVTITRTTAALNTYFGGQLTFTDGSHSVRIPIVARSVPLAAPPSVTGPATGIDYGVRFGYTGTFAATPRGLVAAATTDGSVVDDPGDSFSPTGAGVASFPVVIPPGTTYARFSLFDNAVTPSSDLDLYVYRGSTLVAASGSGTSNEEANLPLNPAAGTYTVYVHGFNVTAPVADFTLFTWVLPASAAGNMAVTAPGAASTGTDGTIHLSFSALVPGTKYLGSVAYTGSLGMPSPTIVRVDP
jgi:hypothetical protein